MNPFEPTTPAEHQQRAAIDAMRAKQAAAKGPTVFFPFGKQQPLQKYVGAQVMPFQKNRFVDQPEQLLLEPSPGAHYGWAQWSSPEVKGKLRSGQYELVYLDELRHDNDASIYTEDVTTETGLRKLVLWHGLALIRIPEKSWYQNYEMPALMSAVRISQHQEAFQDFRMAALANSKNEDVMSGDFSGLRGKAELEMKIDVG